MSKTILVIDDEESLRFTFKAFLADSGYDVITAASAKEAATCFDAGGFDLVFLDIMLGRDSGLDLLKTIRERFAICPVVMITGAPEVDTAAEAVRRGAFDYIPKPVRQETLLRVTKMALDHKEVVDQRERYRANLDAIFKSVQDGLLLVSHDLKILEMNQAMETLFGLPEQVRGMGLSQLPENIREPFSELVETTFSGNAGLVDQRLEIVNPSREQKVFNLSTAPWYDQQNVARGVVLTIRDVTRLDGLERDLKKRRNFEHIIGQGEAIQAVFSLIENLAEVDTTVLIVGESGTGKELVAEALHYRSARRDKSLIKVNCAALPENLLESELFGHLKGSFTGALKDKIGRFQQADGGTIFLDEIGDISPAMQVRLLRVLQNKEIEKVGASEPIQVDVRIVAATHQNLKEKVASGEFREDLFYRLRVVQIPLPPLRERREDIPLLVDHFLDQYNQRFNRQIVGVSDDVLGRLTRYDWPGNIRELQHAVEHAFVLCREETISTTHLPPELTDPSAPICPVTSEEDEVDKLVAALEKAAWNKSRAAKLLGISRRTIYRKIEEHGLEDPCGP